MVAREIGDDVPPRPVRFGEAVEQNDRRMGGVAGDLDVEFYTCRKGDAFEVGHFFLPSRKREGPGVGAPPAACGSVYYERGAHPPTPSRLREGA